jgi:hypothetical protein
MLICTSIKAHAFPLRKIPQKENFVKCDWPTQIFRRFEVENFQLLTMIFLENFLSVEIFLEWKFFLSAWKWALIWK